MGRESYLSDVTKQQWAIHPRLGEAICGGNFTLRRRQVSFSSYHGSISATSNPGQVKEKGTVRKAFEYRRRL